MRELNRKQGPTRSSIVAPRLGFDLRPYYDEVFDAPLPGPISRLGEKLAEIAAPEPAQANTTDEPASPLRRP